jgi:hypothetical protein
MKVIFPDPRLALFLVALAGCRGEPPIHWPFPLVETEVKHDDQAVMAILEERTRPPESLYAELRMSFQQGDRGGVCDAVVRYARPGRLRMTAFRDFLLSTHSIFDLLIDGQHSELTLSGEASGGEAQKFSGTVEELARAQPGFRTFSILREGFFLPGTLPGGGLERVERSSGALTVIERGPDGSEVRWLLDPLTLGVRRGVVRVRGESSPITLQFSSYREVNGRYFPERFALDDPGGKVRVEGLLRELELSVPVEKEAFSRS